MTEITKFNFYTKLKELFNDVRDADFVCIDTNVEVTGFLKDDESIPPHLFEENWYDYIVKNQKTRSPTELGLAIFKRVPVSVDEKFSLGCNIKKENGNNNVLIKTYCIPILSRTVEEYTSCLKRSGNTEEQLDFDKLGMEFMKKRKVDLHKVVYAGTPFGNLERLEAAKVYMERNPDFMVSSGTELTNGDLDPYYFPKIIPRVDEMDIEEILFRLKGIANIIDVIAEAKTPVVGHNLLIKLILLYKDFVQYLPQDFKEFMTKLKAVLPQFYDTKFITSEILSRASTTEFMKKRLVTLNLYELYRQLDTVGKDQLCFIFEEETKNVYYDGLQLLRCKKLEEDGDSLCHQSGFDAIVAGILFYRLIFLDIQQSDLSEMILLDKDFFRHGMKPVWKNEIFLPKVAKFPIKTEFIKAEKVEY